MGKIMQDKRLVIAISLCLLLVAGLAFFLGSRTGGFNTGQKQEIEKIIRSYLIENPQVLRDVIVALEKQEKEKVRVAQKKALSDHAEWINRSPDDFVAGNPLGDVTLVEFFDYNCGYCKRAASEVQALISKDPKIRVVLKEMPILGPDSIFAARAALASKKQGKYWEYHLALLGNKAPNNRSHVLRIAKQVGLDVKKLQQDMLSPEIIKQLTEIEKISTALGVRSTPAFILDDEIIPGALPHSVLSQLIAELRQKGGCKLC